MKIVVQKVKEAQVVVREEIVGQIGNGYVLLVALEAGDNEKDVYKAAEKIANLRIFEDEEGKLNNDIKAEQGEILSISQFTLAGDVHKGNRPSFTKAMRPEQAAPLFDIFNETLRNIHHIHVETGVFQTHMNVKLDNDGPVTLILQLVDGKLV